MADFEQEKEGASKAGSQTVRPRPAKNQDLFADARENFSVGVLSTLKKTRDDIDQAVPKILALSREERLSLSIQAKGTSMILIGARRAYSSPTSDSKGASPDKRVEALDSMSKVLGMDTSKISPSKLKEYETMVKQAWSTAKASLDESLESAPVKQLRNKLGDDLAVFAGETLTRGVEHQKSIRDAFDQKVPKVLSMRIEERYKMAAELSFMDTILKPDSATAAQMSKLSGLLQSDPKRVGPAAYRAQVQKLWTVVKTGIDSKLEHLKPEHP